MDGFFKMIMAFFVLVFIVVISGIVFTMFMGYQCYASNDPNSTACYMISDRVEVGIRERR